MNLIIVLLVILLLFGGGISYHQWGLNGGIGIGGVILLILILYLLGVI